MKQTYSMIFVLLGVLSFTAVTFAEEIPTPQFKPQLIGAIEKGYGLSTGDVDGDGKRDVLLADRWDFVWFRNGDWKRFLLASRLDNQGAMSIDARDIDGDGKAEIAICTRNPKASLYYLVRPKDVTQLWKPLQLPCEPEQHRLRWARDAKGNHHIISVPNHGRPRKVPAKIFAYEYPKDLSLPFKRKLLMESLHELHDFAVVKEKKGKADKLHFVGREGVELMGLSTKKPWEPTGVKQFKGMTTGLGEIDEGRTPQCSFIATIEPKHGTHVVVYPADAKGQFGKKRIVLDDTLKSGHALYCADLLGIGRDQIIAGWWGENKKEDSMKKDYGIRLYVPINNEATKWKTYTIDKGVMACQSIQITDLNSDGKLDIIAAGWSTNNLIVYWNQTSKKK